MAARPKLTSEQWQAVRDTWEADARPGWPWLVAQMALPVSAEAVRQRAKAEGWEKGRAAPPAAPAVKVGPAKLASPPKLALVGKVGDGGGVRPDGPKPTGRPTLYREEYDEEAHKLCLLGYTESELAEHFGVTLVTVRAWMRAHPRFLSSIMDGKDKADSEIAASLYQRARGYSHDAVHIALDKGEAVITDYVKHYPPDTAAASLWLRNRQPKRWRDRVEIQEDVNLNIFPPREILESLHAESLRRAGERAAILTNRRERLGVLIDADEDIDDVG